MAAIETGIFQKLLAFLSSPLTQAASAAIELGGKKAGEKLSEKVSGYFEVGKKTLQDEVLTDSTLTHLSDPAIGQAFEKFMVWLQAHPENGSAKAEKVREIIIRKISTKEVRKGGNQKIGEKDKGKSSSETTTFTDYDFSLAVDFIKRMMSQGNNEEIYLWLKGKNFFSTIEQKTTSGFEKASTAVKKDATNAAEIITQELINLSKWLDSKSRK